MINIVCFNWGNYSGSGQQCVETLYSMVARNITYDVAYRFICFTDDQAAYKAPIQTRHLTLDLKGHLNKLHLFKENLFSSDDLVLFLDINTLIVGPLDFIFQYTGSFAILRDFFQPNTYNTAVMLWRGDYNTSIWGSYRDAGFPKILGDEEAWIEKNAPVNIEILQDIFPFRFVCYTEDGRGDMPAETSVLCFRKTDSTFPVAAHGRDSKIQDWVRPFLTSDRERVIFIANNPEIDEADIVALDIQPDDTLIQFNKAPFFEICREAHCHKIHVFNYGAGKWWGFSSEAEPNHDYMSQKSQSITLLFRNYFSPEIKSFLKARRETTIGGVLNLKHIPQNIYPEGKAPSIGFVTVLYFRYINNLRFLEGLRPLKLVLLGFSGKYPSGKSWSGHDFKFEQKNYDTWLDLSRLDHDHILPSHEVG
jgi:hypothetical protein